MLKFKVITSKKAYNVILLLSFVFFFFFAEWYNFLIAWSKCFVAWF